MRGARAAKEKQLTEVAEARAAEQRFGVKIISTSPRLGDFVNDLYIPAIEAQSGAKSTSKHSLARVVAALGHIPMDKLSPVDVERYKIDRLKIAKTATVAKEVRMLNAAINRAMSMDLIDRNPVAKVKPPRVVQSRAIEFFTKEDLERIYLNADKYPAVWKFMANTGLRRGEMAKARRSDVICATDGLVLKVESIEDDREEGTMVTNARANKSRKVRYINLNEAARSALSELGSDLLVGLTEQGMDKAWNRVRQRTGITQGMHALRHTFATHLVKSGVSIRIVQELMGHATIAMTERYAHVASESTGEAVNSIALYVTRIPAYLSHYLSQRDERGAKLLN